MKKVEQVDEVKKTWRYYLNNLLIAHLSHQLPESDRHKIIMWVEDRLQDGSLHL